MLSDPPAADELEVSIFGPGKGESILVHLGFDEWLVVDSCVDQSDGTVPALEYMKRIGVDAAEQVRFVVATHAHDDHIAGISRIFDACCSAFFVCSSAMTREEFFAMVEIDQTNFSLRERIRKEYQRVFQAVEDRGRAKNGLKYLRRALHGIALLESHGAPPLTVRCLSPSDEAMTRANAALAGDYPCDTDLRRSPVADPNELAVAIWIERGDKAVLLGADLLKGPQGCGWGAVLATFSPSTRASLFKIPHHGAPNADHRGVWEDLVDAPIALLAPFRAGVHRRPDPADVERLKGDACEVHITASPDQPAASNRIRREAAALGPLAQNVRDPWGKPGHVRARARLGSQSWTVSHAAPARRL